jgi:hypothetical protein
LIIYTKYIWDRLHGSILGDDKMCKKYPVEFEGRTVFVTVPEDEPTKWAGGENGPVFPEDNLKKGDDAKCPNKTSWMLTNPTMR